MKMLNPQLFLSHSSTDKPFVRKLAADLVARDISVWFDEWEIAVGDSLMTKIEEGITSSAYFGIVLSKASVGATGWVRRELETGFAMELEKRRVFLLPILLEQCEVPPLLKGKKYANFASDYETGLQELVEAIKAPDLGSHGRAQGGEYITDWAVDWLRVGDSPVIDFVFLMHSGKLPYSVMVKVRVVGNDIIDDRMAQIESAGFDWAPRTSFIGIVLQMVEARDLRILIEDDDEAEQFVGLEDPKVGSRVSVAVSARRLGPDPGTDVAVQWGNTLRDLLRAQVESIKKAVPQADRQAYADWLMANPPGKPAA